MTDDPLPRRIAWFAPWTWKRHLFARLGLFPFVVAAIVILPFVWLLYALPISKWLLSLLAE